MEELTHTTWFQTLCPHRWRTVSTEEIHDPVDASVIYGTRTVRTCAICGLTTKSNVS